MHASKRGLLLAALTAAAVAAAAAAAAWSANSASSERSTRSGWGPSEARTFSAFALYWLGESFEGLPLQAVTRRADARDPAQRVHANYVSFIYGDCSATSENGCAPPLEVQVWPACDRSLGDYTLTPTGEPVPHVATIVRGVPGAYFEDGLRLELYTGRVTVVLFGLEPDRVTRAAAALRAANAFASPRPLLPPPAAGALAGTLGCDG